jgi:hypothetical protein
LAKPFFKKVIEYIIKQLIARSMHEPIKGEDIINLDT